MLAWLCMPTHKCRSYLTGHILGETLDLSVVVVVVTRNVIIWRTTTKVGAAFWKYDGQFLLAQVRRTFVCTL